MGDEIKLSTLLNDPKKASYIFQLQITLNYCDLQLINRIPSRFLNVTKLFLSHNKISNLSGIEQFKALTHLSIGYNQIEDFRELNKVYNKENLKYLAIQGNPLENHPNHKILILEIFPNLEKMDNLTVDRKFRVLLGKKTSLIQKNLISFLYFLFDEINNLEILLSKLRISEELKAFKQKFETNDYNPQEKLNEFMDSQKNLIRFKNLFDFQRIERLKEFLYSRKFGTKTDFSSILNNISEILLSLYGSFDNIILNNRQAFYTIYKCLYIELIEKLNKRFDKNLEYFLVQKIMVNEMVCKEKFSEDNDYAIDCMLSAFYQLLPTQAFISNIICYDKKNDLLSPSKEYFQANDQSNEKGFCNLSPDNLSNRIYKWEHGKEIWKFKKNEIINNLEINENNPENIKNVLLIHFPIFPLNKNYMECILEILNNKFQLMLSFYHQILEIIDVPKNLKSPNYVTNKNIQNQLGTKLFEKTLKTLKYSETNKTSRELKTNEDKEINTNEEWDKSSTMKIKKKLEQQNEIFTVDKPQIISQKNLAKKNATLKKSIIKKKNQETTTFNSDFEKISIDKIKKLKNFILLCGKIFRENAQNQMKWSFESFKKNYKAKKRERKHLLLHRRKKLENLVDLLAKFTENSKENKKKLGLYILKKNTKKKQKLYLLKKIKERKIFYILYENYAKKKKEVADHYVKMLKFKVFLHFLKILYNKKQTKESISRLINFYKHKQMKSSFRTWKFYRPNKNEKNNIFEKSKSFFSSSSSKLKQFLTEDREKINNSVKEKDKINENYDNSNFPLQKLENPSKLLPRQKVCKCKHYFRKCGACKSIEFK